MQRQLVIVGVFGGDGQRALAECVGRDIVVSGQVLLTGGRRNPKSERTTEAAQNGAESATKSGYVARAIGILPDGRGRMFPMITEQDRTLFVESGISHKKRDATNGATADVVIAVRGSTGTLTEIAFAHYLGKPVVLLGSKTHLRNKLAEHGPQPSGDGELANFLMQGLITYPQWNPDGSTMEALESGLDDCLRNAVEFNESNSAEAVQAAIEFARKGNLNTRSGFPGIPPDLAASKATFEAVLKQF
jgi:uncharacterized protein (TIGR00725 family)